MRMTRKLRDAWTAALRSGKYKQASNALKKYNTDGTVAGYCCLGLLQELLEVPETVYLGSGFFDGNVAVLDLATQNELDCFPRGFYVEKLNNWITTINDQGVSFVEIADLVEQYVELID